MEYLCKPRKESMKKLIFGIASLLIVFAGGCKKKNPLDVDVSHLDAQVKVTRFDTLFYGGNPENLPQLKKQFPLLFNPRTPDSIWIAKMQDALFLDVRKEVEKVFPDKLGVETELKNVFLHIKYYFPSWQEPELITLYSDWDYMKRIYLADSLVFIFLDNYLGRDNPIYDGIPQYIRQTMSKEYIPVDFAEKTAVQTIPPPKSKDFLSKMIYHGKILYLKKAFMPQAHDSLLLGYTTEKWKWAEANEKNIWLYFLENDLLFDTDKNLDNRFLNPAPFSKFYTDIDNESAGMIGRFTGYKIVQSYMDKTGADISTLIRTPAQEIFQKSKYKP